MPATEERNTVQSTLPREPERSLVTWIAPSRPFKIRDKQFYITAFAMAGIVCLVLFFAEGAMPVMLIISLVFLYYILSTVEPENIEYKITNKGVKIAGNLTEWQKIKRFWFSTRLDSHLLVLEITTIPGRLELVIKPEIEDELKDTISDYVVFEEAPASGLEKITNWVAQKLPSGNKG